MPIFTKLPTLEEMEFDYEPDNAGVRNYIKGSIMRLGGKATLETGVIEPVTRAVLLNPEEVKSYLDGHLLYLCLVHPHLPILEKKKSLSWYERLRSGISVLLEERPPSTPEEKHKATAAFETVWGIVAAHPELISKIDGEDWLALLENEFTKKTIGDYVRDNIPIKEKMQAALDFRNIIHNLSTYSPPSIEVADLLEKRGISPFHFLKILTATQSGDPGLHAFKKLYVENIIHWRDYLPPNFQIQYEISGLKRYLSLRFWSALLIKIPLIGLLVKRFSPLRYEKITRTQAFLEEVLEANGRMLRLRLNFEEFQTKAKRFHGEMGEIVAQYKPPISSDCQKPGERTVDKGSMFEAAIADPCP